jgi:hypothetical protein
MVYPLRMVTHRQEQSEAVKDKPDIVQCQIRYLRFRIYKERFRDTLHSRLHIDAKCMNCLPQMNARQIYGARKVSSASQHSSNRPFTQFRQGQHRTWSLKLPLSHSFYPQALWLCHLGSSGYRRR